MFKHIGVNKILNSTRSNPQSFLSHFLLIVNIKLCLTGSEFGYKRLTHGLLRKRETSPFCSTCGEYLTLELQGVPGNKISFPHISLS